MVMTMWCMATPGFKFRMLTATTESFHKSSQRFSFSCRMLTKVMDVRWCGLLIANWAPNFVTRVSKQFMDLGGKRVNQLRFASFREVWKSLQKIMSSDVCKLIFVKYISICSSRTMESSYLFRAGPFQLAGSSVFIMFSVNRCLLEDKPKVLIDGWGLDISSYEILVSFSEKVYSLERPCRVA